MSNDKHSPHAHEGALVHLYGKISERMQALGNVNFFLSISLREL